MAEGIGVSDNSNEVFQSAVNNAAILKAVICFIGVACIFMGYRLLVAALNRRGLGIIFAVFGMAIIAVAIFRTVPVASIEKTDNEGTVPQISSHEAAPIIRNSKSPARSASRGEALSTKVR